MILPSEKKAKILFVTHISNDTSLGGKEMAFSQKVTEWNEDLFAITIIQRQHDKSVLKELFLIEVKALLYAIFGQYDCIISRGYSPFLLIMFNFLLGRRLKLIREVHSDAINEAKLRTNKYQLLSRYFLPRLDRILDLLASKRIYNHPYLKDELGREGDLTLYNGFSNRKIDHSKIKPELVLKMNSIKQEFDIIITMAGVASPWHGTDKIVKLFSENNTYLAENKICLLLIGGTVSKSTDCGTSNIINIPLVNPNESEYIIQTSNIGIVGCDNLRRSPGSPLKLFQYIKYDKVIMGPAFTLGFSDVGEHYGKYIGVDFNNIADFPFYIDLALSLENEATEASKIHQFSWSKRAEELKGML
jgi:hypothetical protein